MIQIVTGVDDTGAEGVDTYEAPDESFSTEHSGVLTIYRGKHPWAAYAPGAWKRVNHGPSTD